MDGDHPENLTSDIQTSENSLIFTLQVPWDDLQTYQQIIDGINYTTLALSDWSTLAKPGEPALPYFSTAVGAPIGAQVSIEISPGNSYKVPVSAPILPAATQWINWEAADLYDSKANLPQPEVSYQPQMDVYSQKGTYPGILGEILTDGQLRQQRVIGVGLYPFQYDPTDQHLIIYETLKVALTFQGTPSIDSESFESDSQPYEAFLRSNLMNYEQAQAWRQRLDFSNQNGAQTPYTINNAPSWALPNPSWRIALQEEGIYRLTYAELAATTFPVSTVDPSHIQLFNLGEEVAIYFEGDDDSTFESDESFYFYGQAISNKYTADNIYWLTTSAAGGKRMPTRDVTPDSETTPSSYRELKTFEENHYYLTAIPGNDALERFMWTYVYPTSPDVPKSWSHTFQLTAPTLSEAAITVHLLGYSSSSSINPDHHAVIHLNDNPIGETWWDGATLETLELAVSPAYINNGENTLKIELPNDTGADRELVYVDKFELAYDRGFQAKENQLSFSYDQPGTWQFQIEGFSSAPQALYNISDPIQVEQLVGYTADTTSLHFTDTISEEKVYWAVGSETVKSVDSIVADVASNLLSTANTADYILITPDDFWDQAQVLATYRETQDLVVKLVRLQDIYDEFNFGIADANAIHDFLQFAYDYWRDPEDPEDTAPSYVLLLGDGHYDPKNYLGYGRESFIPPFLAVVDPWIGETASDNRYVTLSGEDTMPDMMIGRLAVNTSLEAENFINKIINYEDNPPSGGWKEAILAVADNQDSGGNFPAHSDNIISDHLPPAYHAERVYLNVTHYTKEAVRTAVVDQINAGKLFVQYVGHASYTAWAQENLFSNTTVASLTNGAKTPIFLPMTCYEGFFHRPHTLESNQEAVAEVVTRAVGRGAIASWSPTGLGISSGHDYLISGFYDAVFKDRTDSIGEATTAGKLSLWQSGANLDLLDTYTLFGDPATSIPLSFLAAGDDYEVYEDETLIVSPTDSVLLNDFHPENAELTAILVEDVSNGVLNLAPDGSFTYTPEADYFGFDSFTYKANDGVKDSNTVSVSIRIYGVNDAPIAHDQNLTTDMNTSVNITLTATDDGGGSPDSSPIEPIIAGSEASPQAGLTYEVLTQPTQGTLSGTAPDLVYTPNTDFFGTDSFTFKANDGSLDSNTATVTIQVEAAFQFYIPLINH